MKRVLAGGGLIPSLVDYFDPDIERMPKQDVAIDLADLGEYDLNASQEEALRTALSYGPISLLQGPPGTGKTKFIASFVHLLLSRGLARNILLVSQSHEAVNNAMDKVAGSLRASSMDVSMVRVGLQSMVSPGLRSVQEDSLRQRYREVLTRRSRIVCERWASPWVCQETTCAPLRSFTSRWAHCSRASTASHARLTRPMARTPRLRSICTGSARCSSRLRAPVRHPCVGRLRLRQPSRSSGRQAGGLGSSARLTEPG